MYDLVISLFIPLEGALEGAIFHKCLVDETIAAWSRVVACEVPVALVLRASGVQAVDCLKDELHRCLHSCWTKHFGHLPVDVFNAERFVDGTDAVALLCCWLTELRKT